MKRIALFCIIVLLFSGCASFVDNTYKTLYVAGQAYDAGMKTIADLQAQGKITEAQRAEINSYANKFYVSYQAAASALSTYNKTKTAADEDKLAVAITELIRSWKVYAQAANTLLPGIVPVEVN
jgi:PBP1b-binding outer membrane lipoprotein LpoB